MSIYTLMENGSINRNNEDGTITLIPPVSNNSDYQAYLAQLPKEGA
jgi:hypothetical protein